MAQRPSSIESTESHVGTRGGRRSATPRLLKYLLALSLLLLSACTVPLPDIVPPSASPVAPVAAPRASGTGVPAPPVSSPDVLALPAAFRYEVTLRPVQADAPMTVISGQYRDGAWAQISRTGDQQGEELVVARDASTGRLRSYTRAAGDSMWTRWPGVTFDAAYGLASPFTVLRLRPLATRSALTGESEPGATPDPDGVKTQSLFSTGVVRGVLIAGVLATATDEETRSSLEQQIASLFVPQTVTYWTDPEGRVSKAAATLLSLGRDNEPAPTIELTASYFAYDDPTIVIAVPSSSTDIRDVAGKDAVAEQASDVLPGVTLRVRVFATAGVPASDSVVTAYLAGKRTIAGEKLGPDAQLALKPGLYDILVRSGGAEQWLRGITVTKDAVVSNDVLFDFAQLTVTVILAGAMPAADIVVYPAGEKTNFVGFVSLNPAQFQLPAGEYDVEAATQDGKAHKRVTGVVVRGGLDAAITIDLSTP